MASPKLSKVSATTSKTIEVTFDQAMLEDSLLKDAASYDLVPDLVSESLISVDVLSPSVVRLNLPINMKHGQVYTLSVIGGLRNLALEIMDPGGLSEEFQGIGDPPKIDSSTALSESEVEVVFDEPINVALATKIENWKITSQITGKEVVVSGVSPFDEGTGLFKKFFLAISSKMTDGGIHTLAVYNLEDVAGNSQLTFESSEFVGIAVLPRIISAEIDETKSGDLFVSFDTPMDRVSAVTLQSYNFLWTPGSSPVYYDTASISEDRKLVRISIGETKIDAPYAVIAMPNVTDDYGNSIDPLHNQFTFIGSGTAPTIARAIGVGQNRIDLVFSEFMYDNESIRDPLNYSADGGLQILQVLEVDGETVKLATTDQIPGVKYTLTVS